jgi:hypothetical protein
LSGAYPKKCVFPILSDASAPTSDLAGMSASIASESPLKIRISDRNHTTSVASVGIVLLVIYWSNSAEVVELQNNFLPPLAPTPGKAAK